MKKAIVTAFFATSVCLTSAACSNDAESNTASSGSNAEETTSKIPHAERKDGETWEVEGDDGSDVQVTKNSIGNRIETETAFLEVISVEEAQSLDFTMPDEVENPRDGAKFVLVKAEVENKGPGVWDLTCHSTGSWFQTQLQTTEGNFYLEEAYPYRIEGNPPCNDSVGAGIPVEMTWYYELPADAKPSEFVFVDPKYAEDSTEQVNLVVLS